MNGRGRSPMGNKRLSKEQTKGIEHMALDNKGSALLPVGDKQSGLVNQDQPRPSPDADAGMRNAEARPPRSAHTALVVSSSLSAQVPSRQAHADVTTATPVDRAERANKWVVLVLAGTAAFMTTLDASIV